MLLPLYLPIISSSSFRQYILTLTFGRQSLFSLMARCTRNWGYFSDIRKGQDPQQSVNFLRFKYIYASAIVSPAAGFTYHLIFIYTPMPRQATRMYNESYVGQPESNVPFPHTATCTTSSLLHLNPGHNPPRMIIFPTRQDINLKLLGKIVGPMTSHSFLRVIDSNPGTDAGPQYVPHVCPP